jgi:hypothetical protein
MIFYAMALPERYDITCGAFAFALIVTLAASGIHSVPLIGSMLGLCAAMFIFSAASRRVSLTQHIRSLAQRF